MMLSDDFPQLAPPSFYRDLKIKEAHFIGACGSGMKPLAHALLTMGVKVTGSDPAAGHRNVLHELGALLFDKHDAVNLQAPDVVVYSTAIPNDNPELVEARRRKVQLLHRSEMLAWFLARKESILVAGTHGKTTTSGMLTVVMEAAGLNPWGFVGGTMACYGGNVRVGGERFAVAEADESDGTFLSLPRDHAIITNIEAEHLNYWKNEERLFRGFQEFATTIPAEGKLIVCGDDSGIQRFLPTISKSVIVYSLSDPAADYYGRPVEEKGSGSVFELWQRGVKLGEVPLGVPGRHNMANALSVFALTLELGGEFGKFQNALESFAGVNRRFTKQQAKGGFLVIDDYAHHPTEINATMKAARLLADERGGKLRAVFQPHRYTRTQTFFDAFGPALSLSDELFILDVFAAGESALEGISGQSLADHIASQGVSPVYYTPTFDELKKNLEERGKLSDIVLLLGAGSVTKMTDLLCSC